MEYVIKEETVNKVLTYLGSKPWIEVASLMEEVKQVAPIKKEVKKEDIKKDK